MTSSFDPGTEVYVRGMSRSRKASVVRDSGGECVRVLLSTGKERSIRRERLKVAAAPPPRPMLAECSTTFERPPTKAQPKPAPPGRSRSYLALVRGMCCTGCGASGPCEAHHWGPRGMGQKASDFRTVPLCVSCHREFHDTGRVSALGPKMEAAFYEQMVRSLVIWAESEKKR